MVEGGPWESSCHEEPRVRLRGPTPRSEACMSVDRQPRVCVAGHRRRRVRPPYCVFTPSCMITHRRNCPDTSCLSKQVSDRRSRDAAAGYGGNDHIVRAHTAAGTEQRGAPPPAQCMFTRRTIEEARWGGASLSEQRGHGGAANQRRHG